MRRRIEVKVPKFLKWLDRYLEEAILVIFLILIACIMMFQVVVRYAFKNPLPWPEEFCRYCFVWSAMLATGYCIRKGSMLRVDMVINMFPRPVAAALDVVSKILAVAFCCIMFMPSWEVMQNSLKIGQLSPAMQMPIWILYLSAPLGFFSGIIRGIQSVILTLMELKNGDKKTIEGGENA